MLFSVEILRRTPLTRRRVCRCSVSVVAHYRELFRPDKRLHSGARYAVTDAESARECISENQILKRIARHCVEPTNGLFITLPEDDLSFQATFIRACEEAGISAEAIDPQQARIIEPAVNPALIGAVKVPDGTVDPFRLTAANMLDAKEHGAVILTAHEVTGLIREGATVCGVRVRNHLTGEIQALHAPVVVNAAGIWGQHIAEYADLRIRMFPAKGSLLIMDHRINQHVINRCRKPSDADILVPGDTISLIGTTSLRIDYSEIDDNRVTAEEVDILLREGEKLAPVMAKTRILRAYSGVRPLVASDDDPSGRAIGAALANPDRKVLCFSGDGSLMMNIQEMATASENQLDVKIILMNNEALGLVHQQQSLFYKQGVFAATYPGKINFMQIAAGFGLETCDLNNEADPQAALQEIINRPGPALIHVRIDAEEKVYPMVPPGAANTEMVGE